MNPPEDFQPPEQFDEYRLIRPLGKGGMGEVFLCHDTKLDRRVAVKFIRRLGADSAARKRFEIEARAIARLEAHNNVVAVYRLGDWGGSPYLVSQFIPGKSLDQRPKPIPWSEVLSIGIGLTRGLVAAHAQRVLHRDIKPANIIQSDDGQIKLLDFGLAKLLDNGPSLAEVERPPEAPASATPFLAETLPGVAASPGFARSSTEGEEGGDGVAGGARGRRSELSSTGHQLGTPLYMSPEAWRGERATERSDIYSLGAVLYELASGVPPHNYLTYASLRDAVQHEEAPPLSQLVAEFPPRLREAVERCLRRDPAERFVSAGELLTELEAILRETSAPPGNVPAPRPRYGTKVAAGLLLALALAGGAWALWNRPAATILIPGGKFTMGSTAREMESAWEWCGLADRVGCERALYEREQPLREVTVSTFRIDRTEVTQSDYVAWLNRQKDLHLEEGNFVKAGNTLLIDIYPTFNPSHGIVYDASRKQYRVLAGYERQPVVQVTWDGAQRYCRSHGQRLPTEAEWEFAARGPQSRRFPWGNDEPRCDGVAIARASGLPCATTNPGPQDVGTTSQDRTPEGVADMGGNISEWVADYFVDRYLPCSGGCRDPVVGVPALATSGPFPARAFRGGNWNAGGSVSRAASRSKWQQNLGGINIGFRCAASAVK